jgi:hypothetical protein
MANVDKAFGLRARKVICLLLVLRSSTATLLRTIRLEQFIQGDLVTIFDGFVVKFAPATHTAAVGVFNGVFYTDPTTGKPTFKNFYPGSVNITSRC